MVLINPAHCFWRRHSRHSCMLYFSDAKFVLESKFVSESVNMSIAGAGMLDNESRIAAAKKSSDKYDKDVEADKAANDVGTIRIGANAEHDSENIIMSIARAEFEKDIEANDAANKLDASLEVESVVQNRTSAEIDSESIDMSIARDGMMDKISRVSDATQLSDEEAANDFDAVLGVESIKGNRVITELNSINASIDWADMLDNKSRKKDIEADEAANNFDAALGVESVVAATRLIQSSIAM